MGRTENDIEILTADAARGPFEFAVFDFDGTLSLIREGWRSIMIPTMVETLADLDSGETLAELERIVTEFVDTLTGQQTIYQMIRLGEEIEKRGGQSEDPRVYKQHYHERLLEHIENRVGALQSGSVSPDEMMVPGSRHVLKALTERGLKLCLASGTDIEYVKREAELLKIDGFFCDRIYGAIDNYVDFSKAKLLDEILRENGLPGSTLLGFGDGYVEVEAVANVGGTAVGVASDEVNRFGIDAWKRDRLISAGAAFIIPDYREADQLLDILFEN